MLTSLINICIFEQSCFITSSFVIYHQGPSGAKIIYLGRLPFSTLDEFPEELSNMTIYEQILSNRTKLRIFVLPKSPFRIQINWK